MFFSGKKVLVAGGTGLIGIPLVELLIGQGARVRIASLDDKSRAHPESEFIKTDLMKHENCVTVCEGMEYVFNLLCMKGSPAVTNKRPASFFYQNAQMEMNMLEAARVAGMPGYMFASTMGIYAPAPIFHEDSVWTTFPSKNDWFSGWSKRFGELLIEAYRIEYGWKTISIVRPANVFGPYDNFDSENAMVVPSLIKRAVAGENPFVVWGDGSSVRDFMYARDVARAMILAAEKNPQKPVNIGCGVGVSIKQLVEAVLANVEHKPSVVWDTSRPEGDKQRVLDVTRLKALGFAPEVSLQTGIKETMDWYRKNRGKTGLRYDVFNVKRGEHADN